MYYLKLNEKYFERKNVPECPGIVVKFPLYDYTTVIKKKSTGDCMANFDLSLLQKCKISVAAYSISRLKQVWFVKSAHSRINNIVKQPEAAGKFFLGFQRSNLRQEPILKYVFTKANSKASKIHSQTANKHGEQVIKSHATCIPQKY